MKEGCLFVLFVMLRSLKIMVSFAALLLFLGKPFDDK
jgi:hypothetical protein